MKSGNRSGVTLNFRCGSGTQPRKRITKSGNRKGVIFGFGEGLEHSQENVSQNLHGIKRRSFEKAHVINISRVSNSHFDHMHGYQICLLHTKSLK